MVVFMTTTVAGAGGLWTSNGAASAACVKPIP